MLFLQRHCFKVRISFAVDTSRIYVHVVLLPWDRDSCIVFLLQFEACSTVWVGCLSPRHWCNSFYQTSILELASMSSYFRLSRETVGFIWLHVLTWHCVAASFETSREHRDEENNKKSSVNSNYKITEKNEEKVVARNPIAKLILPDYARSSPQQSL